MQRCIVAGQTVKTAVDIKDPFAGLIPAGSEYHVEDWWKNVSGVSWMDAVGNPAALNYAMRSAISGLPFDDAVLYGKIGGLGFLIHVSEVVSAVPIK